MRAPTHWPDYTAGEFKTQTQYLYPNTKEKLEASYTPFSPSTKRVCYFCGSLPIEVLKQSEDWYSPPVCNKCVQAVKTCLKHLGIWER